MSDSPSSVPIWVSALTFFGGLISSQLLEFLKDVRGSKREREARREIRSAAQFDRRNQFQRETLLSLQDELLKLGRTTGSLHILDRVAQRTAGKRWGSPYPEDLDQENAAANARTSMLGSRVGDEEVRALLQGLKDLNVAAFLNENEKESHNFHTQAIYKFDALQKRIGVVLRELDEEEIAQTKG